MSDKDPKAPFKELRPGFVPLKEIAGVDFETCTITRGSDFRNPKTKLRGGVLKSLASATSPLEVSPIEIYLDKGGRYEVLDGDHRVVNALRKCAKDPNHEDWGKIRATIMRYDERDKAIERAMLADVGDGISRSVLTEGEEVGLVERCLAFGWSVDRITERIGRGHARWTKKIMRILGASPEVLEAVKAGTATLLEGVTVADRVDVDAQGDAIAEVIKAKEKREGKTGALREAGVIQERTKTLKLPQIYGLLWPHYKSYMAMLSGTEKKDTFVMGFCGAILRILMLPPNDNERQVGDDELFTNDEIEAQLQPRYEAYLERERNPPKKKGKRNKG